MGVGPLGFVLDRAQWLARFGNGLNNSAFAAVDLAVHAHGGNAAVVVGVDEQRTRYAGGQNDGRFRLTLTAVRPADRWLVASVHIGPLHEPEAAPVSTSMSRDELRRAIDARAVVVVDALPAGPYTRRHLPGALNLVEEDAETTARRVLPDTAAAVVTYSTDAACGRGEALARRLRELGYTNVRTYHEGIEDWVSAGLPIESAAPQA